MYFELIALCLGPPLFLLFVTNLRGKESHVTTTAAASVRNSLGTPNHINGFQSNAFPYTIVFAGKKRSEEERTFCLRKMRLQTHVISVCSRRKEGKKKLGRRAK